MRPFYIDVHVHPGLKPYGNSFAHNPPRVNSPDPQLDSSIWRKDHPNDLERLLERTLGLVKFTQSDFQSLSNGQVQVICASLYSIERGLVRLKTGTGWLTDTLTNFISGLGKARINFLQSNNDYFRDLIGEYEFYKALHNTSITINGTARKYILVEDRAALNQALDTSLANPSVQHVIVIVSIEGMHNLDSNIALAEGDETSFLANADKIKNWEYKPFFVTFAHHFYNKLCGHAGSLLDFIQDTLTGQEVGMNTGFTPLGIKVLARLLDNTHGNRILIDVKHMSPISRLYYYDYLRTHHADELNSKSIPIIISHGACNGFRNIEEHRKEEKAQKFDIDPRFIETGKHMYEKDINFYDDELILVAKSGGIIGIQLDERRIASKTYKKFTRLRTLFASKHKRQLANSRMVWNNIQHIAQVLDQHDLSAWDCMTIGSDYDGLIDSLNLFWSAENMPDLARCIEIKAKEWLDGGTYTFKNQENKITAAVITDKIFYSNAMAFFQKHFKSRPIA